VPKTSEATTDSLICASKPRTRRHSHAPGEHHRSSYTPATVSPRPPIRRGFRRRTVSATVPAMCRIGPHRARGPAERQEPESQEA
jgi:hypothetical protein